MLIYKEKVLKYIIEWLNGNLSLENRETIVCVVTGGIDSCVAASLCFRTVAKKVVLIFMGFKENEALFEKWVTNNFQANKYEIIKPQHPNLDLPNLENIDNKASMSLVYMDLYAKKYNALTVGSINKSEHDLVKFFQKRVDTSFDAYPIIDLFRSEVIELGRYLNLPQQILDAKSITEESFGYTYDELEWVAREDDNLGIVSSISQPTASKYWALYNAKNKKMLSEIHKMKQLGQTKKISPETKCEVRFALPGMLK